MTLCSHGAVRSFSTTAVGFKFLSASPMTHLRACGASSRLGVLDPCRCRRRFFSSASRPRTLVYQRSLKMSSRKTSHQVWHVSRGIVFAGGNSVVYPRLPPVRHHSAPAAVASVESSVCLPAVLTSAGVLEEAPASLNAENAHGDVVTPLAAAGTTIAAAICPLSTIVLAEDDAMIEVEGPEEDDATTSKPKDATPAPPPYTPLAFKIPDKAFQAARQAPDGTPESFWTYTLYRGPGEYDKLDANAKVKVHYCTSLHATERVIKKYFMDEEVLGFDLEWMPYATKDASARLNVSLVQLASPSRIGLFHIAAYNESSALVAPALKQVMESPDITKVGVNIRGDCRRLSDYLSINSRGQFELSHLYRLVKYSKSGQRGLINKRLVSLGSQVEECLGLPMFKGLDVRKSNWSKPLRMDQIIYSSSDAYAAVQLYAVLDHQRQNLDEVPPIPPHAELGLPILVAKDVPPAVTEEESRDPDAADTVIEDPSPVPDEPVREERVRAREQNRVRRIPPNQASRGQPSLAEKLGFDIKPSAIPSR